MNMKKNDKIPSKQSVVVPDKKQTKVPTKPCLIKKIKKEDV